MPGDPSAAPSPDGAAALSGVAFLGRCPRCGRGALFQGLLTVREHCAACGLDLRAQDAGDGPAVFAILLVGAVAVGGALVLEVQAAPPLWVHAIVWPAVVLPLSVGVMRVLKAGLIALQWRHRRDTVGGV
ncbi:MAG: DUF983 domain-containing protein [Acetobacteraceae bacterium]|nr:DUF983 domain-containing protein [Acetobacteraceae bacterium]